MGSANQWCRINLSVPMRMYTQFFTTESGYDFLYVDGQPYSGSVGPPRGRPVMSSVTWTSDHSVPKRGWKVCFGEWTGANDTSDGWYSTGSNRYSLRLHAGS